MTETTKKIKKAAVKETEEHKTHKAHKVEEEAQDINTKEEEFDVDKLIKESEAKGKGGKKDKYFEAVGRRKSAVARVRLYTKVNGITVNDKALAKYFTIARLQSDVMSPIEKMKLDDKLGAVIKVNGGGISAQAEAARLGIARALVVFNPIFKKRLRRLGLLTRDSRVVERKKYGLKKARRAPQWSKR